MKYLLIAISFLFFIACTENQKPARTDGFTKVLVTKEDSLLQEVMDGHDAGMARMLKLSKYQKKVADAIDSIGKLPSAKRDKAYLTTLEELKEELSYAENSMNLWMEGFKMDSLKDQPTLRLTYLEQQRTTVLKVKEAILNSLGRTDSLFNKK